MDSEPAEDTVVGAPRPVVANPEDVAADTVILDRLPFAELRERLRPRQTQSLPGREKVPPETAPIAYAFSVNSSPPVSLDAPAFIGRRPSLPRIVRGRPPRLVRVPSPRKEVSSTHLELRQQGALVIITDLRSTNGTVVSAPGREVITLRGGESIVVVPGTVVDIGDGNVVEILPLARPLHPEGSRP